MKIVIKENNILISTLKQWEFQYALNRIQIYEGL